MNGTHSFQRLDMQVQVAMSRALFIWDRMCWTMASGTDSIAPPVALPVKIGFTLYPNNHCDNQSKEIYRRIRLNLFSNLKCPFKGLKKKSKKFLGSRESDVGEEGAEEPRLMGDGGDTGRRRSCCSSSLFHNLTTHQAAPDL